MKPFPDSRSRQAHLPCYPMDGKVVAEKQPLNFCVYMLHEHHRYSTPKPTSASADTGSCCLAVQKSRVLRSAATKNHEYPLRYDPPETSERFLRQADRHYRHVKRQDGNSNPHRPSPTLMRTGNITRFRPSRLVRYLPGAACCALICLRLRAGIGQPLTIVMVDHHLLDGDANSLTPVAALQQAVRNPVRTLGAKSRTLLNTQNLGHPSL